MIAPELVLVDGYNVLLALAGIERADPDRFELATARTRLVECLGEWAALKEAEVIVAWDGRSGLPGNLGPPVKRVRVVFLEPPAEADDWIVAEARRSAEERRPAVVVTRDRELISRLPRAVRSFPISELAADLSALSAPTLRQVPEAAAVWDTIPASAAPVDTSRLPRRRRPASKTPAAAPPPPPAAAPPARATGTAPPPAEPSASPKTEAARRRDERRRRWERAQKRKQRR